MMTITVGSAEKTLTGQSLSTAYHRDYRDRTKHKEDDQDVLPIGRLSRDSAVFRKEGDEGVLVRKLVMELPEHAPVVYEPLTDVTGFEGSRVQLACKIIGKPAPHIQCSARARVARADSNRQQSQQH
ncbi:hypothetical protein ACOMHN_009840 [Nucella lapillus]